MIICVWQRSTQWYFRIINFLGWVVLQISMSRCYISTKITTSILQFTISSFMTRCPAGNLCDAIKIVDWGFTLKRPLFPEGGDSGAGFPTKCQHSERWIFYWESLTELVLDRCVTSRMESAVKWSPRLSSSKRMLQCLNGAILTLNGTITSLAPAANAVNIWTMKGSKV